MRIAIIATFRHRTRLLLKSRGFMQSAAPELIAGLCPEYAEVEVYNEQETPVPLDRYWDLVFFSYLDSYYEHTKILSTMFRRAGMTTVAGGRHADHFVDDCIRYFDAVVTGYPEPNIPKLIEDFENKNLQRVYNYPFDGPESIQPYRYDLIDFRTNHYRIPAIEASRGCPFRCNFCVLTGREKYLYRPVKDVIHDITKMLWNQNFLGILNNTFAFYDNNLGGSPQYLRELCEALIPLKKIWGCSLTLNILQDESLIKLMAKAGCRYIYTGVESLNPDSVISMNKHQNRLSSLRSILERTFSNGIQVSFGLLIGSDGDTNEYLTQLPEYLSDLNFWGITFIGIVCPYPGTPFYNKLVSEDRMIPGATIRDFDGFTICHRPLQMDPSEVAEHYINLCTSIPKLTNALKHSFSKLWLSNLPGYKTYTLSAIPEVLSLKKNLLNEKRTYVAGQDAIEEWDAKMMQELEIPTQIIS